LQANKSISTLNTICFSVQSALTCTTIQADLFIVRPDPKRSRRENLN